jgi:hypothetical protein
LYDFYYAVEGKDDVSSTTRRPSLPSHIQYGIHDVASLFKKLVAGLHGGILGSLSTLDALVAVHTQLRIGPESTRTKETRLRARLIALAIGTVESYYRRNLICAVFGLLCLIGRTAENAQREDDAGRPLPTADLMGYDALGIIFGPLLVGDLLDSYSVRVADPTAGLVLLPIARPRSRKERRTILRQPTREAKTSPSVDRVHMANKIAEMVITHWRDVIQHMRSLRSVKTRRDGKRGTLKPSILELDSFGVSLGRPASHTTALERSRSTSPVAISSATPQSWSIARFPSVRILTAH